METPTEGLEPQKIQEPVVSEKVQLTQAELDDLKHKAEVSSQNFERAKKAEERVKILESQNTNIEAPSDTEVFSDEGKALQGKISTVEQQMAELREERDLERLYNQYPLLKEKSSDFIEYRKAEHPRAKLESVAKLFLVENGLLETKRVGLENHTGGDRSPMTSGMTTEQVRDLRDKNPRKYREMLKSGQVKFE